MNQRSPSVREAAHTQWWQIGEVVFGLPFLAALVLQWVVPLTFPASFLWVLRAILGALCCVAGVAIIVLARRELRQHGQPTDPGHPTSNVVSTGVFAWSRNPMYLGVTCFLLGIGLAANLPWVMILLVLSLLACHFILIVPEERYLAAKFGGEYQTYTSTVRRWLGRARNPRSASR